MGFIREDNKTNGNNNNNSEIKTISSKVLATISASNVTLEDLITVNSININKDRRYYIEFLGSKKLCSLLVSEDINVIICSIGNYNIQAFNDSTNITLDITKINTDDTTTDTFTDLIIYEEEVKYLDSKYLETDLVLQNSISLGRVGDIGMGSSAIGSGVEASSYSSHAEGVNTIASGENSHAEGNYTKALGESSHTEGSGTTASGVTSHAEGNSTTASGDYGSHAEGSDTEASGLYSHAEGSDTEALGDSSHAEGNNTHATGENSHAEGKYTEASGESSHTEGDNTHATGMYSHAEGSMTTASGTSSHAEGAGTIASSDNQHVQGKFNIEDTEGKYAHIVGNGEDGKSSNAHTLDWNGNAWYSGDVQGTNLPYTVSSKVLATVTASNVKLGNEIAINNVSINKDRRYYIEFLGNKKLCSLLVSEEFNAILCNIGNYTIQVVNNSTDILLLIIKINEDITTDTFTDLVIYEEEVKCLDSKYIETDLILQNSISLGRAGDIGMGSVAIGSGVIASGNGSHAEGASTTASGECSHAEGYYTIASSDCQHVQGKCNIEDTAKKYAHIVGNGDSDKKRANAHTLDWDGNAWYGGEVYVGGKSQDDGKKLLSTADIYFDENGKLCITINGVTKKFTPDSE